MLGRIRNIYLRRTLIAAAYLPAMLLGVVSGAVEGACIWVSDINRAVRSAWNRP